MPEQLARKLRCIKEPVASQNGNSIIILNNTGLLPEEQLNILEELISYIKK